MQAAYLYLEMPIHHTDIAILGAGPAGATTSLFLAKMGIPHLILDAATFPRDKICGDGLDLKVVRVLRHLDPSIVTDDIFGNPDFVLCWGSRFITQNGRSTEFIYTPKAGDPHPNPLFFIAKRLHFDNFLVQKLDPRFADFRPGTKVDKIERDGQGWRIQARGPAGETEIHAKMLVGADGDHSMLLHSLGERKIDRRHYAGSLRQYWRGVSGMHPKNLIEIYFPKGLPMSYFYMFPLPQGEVNVGFGMVSQLIAKGHYKLREVFQKIIREDPAMAPRFQHAEPLEEPVGWGLPLASRRRKAFGEGYLLVGDAASLICPTSGEGIGTGMVSGFVAAQFIQKALTVKRFDADVFKNYDREIYRRLEGEIRIYKTMMHVSPRLYDFGLNLLAPQSLFQWSFQRRVAGWLRTAYEREIEVRILP